MSKKWSQKTNQEILDDVNRAIKIIKRESEKTNNESIVMTPNELVWWRKVQDEILCNK